MKTLKNVKAIIALGVIGLFITTAHANEDDSREMENSRIEATQLIQLEADVDSIDAIVNGIQEIAKEIGNSTTDRSHIMTGIGQLEDEAIQLNDTAQQLKYSSESSMDGAMIEKASKDIAEIKVQVENIHSTLKNIKK